jgi:hypothetical protein
MDTVGTTEHISWNIHEYYTNKKIQHENTMKIIQNTHKNLEKHKRENKILHVLV